MDLHSRKIIGWATSKTMQASLVCEALKMAIHLRQPKPQLIVHSDRGSQYASNMHRMLLKQHGFIQRMSQKASCWDNAVMERSFLNLKKERLWQSRYANHLEATKDINHYIVAFYNTKKLHSQP